MRKLRNSFYNISDIFVAVIIVCIAAGLILWRTNIILGYPEKLVAEAFAENNQTHEPITTPYEHPEDDTTSEGGVTDEKDAEIFSVYINMGDSVTAIGQTLTDIGCFESAKEFADLVSAKGADTKLQMGMHYFPANASKDEIVEALMQPGL